MTERYILATGDHAAVRLELLDRIFGPGTREFLKSLHVPTHARIAEIGCGTGLTTLCIASQLVPYGTVTAVDASREQLKVAEMKARSAGISNICFHHADAYNLSLPPSSFDLVYSRFLLCHLDSPADALSEMQILLKPGGILVCEDHDDGGIFTEPPTDTYRRVVEISKAVNRSRGLDPYIGLKLPSLFRAAGLSRPEIKIRQLVYLRGDEKRFWELTLREATAAILAVDVATLVELETICHEICKIAKDESTLVMLARVTQVWAKQPGSGCDAGINPRT